MFARIFKFLRYAFGGITEQELDEAERRWPGAKQRYANYLAKEAARAARAAEEKPLHVPDHMYGYGALNDPTHPRHAQLMDERYGKMRH